MQAMALTAIVISFGVAALLLSLVYRVYTSHFSLDLDELAEAEEREEAIQELEVFVGSPVRRRAWQEGAALPRAGIGE